MTRIIINGSKGRMGQALLQCAREHPELQIVGQADLGDDLTPLLPQADAVVDFTLHDATPQVASLCGQYRKALVIGTTGHSQTEKDQVLHWTSHIPIVWASNYSTGVNTLFWLTRQAARILGPHYDLEVVEMHHRQKHDAPSGTATTLAEILAQARQVSLPQEIQHGRHGITGPRSATEIGMHSLRGGDVVGDHTVIFAATGERLELTHKASSRNTFAHGALRAAHWAVSQSPGLYNMQDVLGLND